MSDRDLTPEEARAEVEAFMGEGWTVSVRRDSPKGAVWMCAEQRCVFLEVNTASCKTAVSALKAAWRDAVRPWVKASFDAGADYADDARSRDYNSLARLQHLEGEAIARVLGEDSNG